MPATINEPTARRHPRTRTTAATDDAAVFDDTVASTVHSSHPLVRYQAALIRANIAVAEAKELNEEVQRMGYGIDDIGGSGVFEGLMELWKKHLPSVQQEETADDRAPFDAMAACCAQHRNRVIDHQDRKRWTSISLAMHRLGYDNPDLLHGCMLACWFGRRSAR